MTPRRVALAVSSPSIVVLLATGVWNLWDRRADIVRWAIDWT